MQDRFYTGVGSRETPWYICNIMTVLASILEAQNFILRSGGALGADQAFEKGVSNPSRKMTLLADALFVENGKNILYTKYQISESRIFINNNNVHPLWHNLKEYAKKMHTRNIFQVMGLDLDKPAKFTVCWTRDAAKTIEQTSRKTGGTGTAIKASCINNIPVYNLANYDDLNRILNYMEKKLEVNTFNQLVNDIPDFEYKKIA